jgi:hypothetical protein
MEEEKEKLTKRIGEYMLEGRLRLITMKRKMAGE